MGTTGTAHSRGPAASARLAQLTSLLAWLAAAAIAVATLIIVVISAAGPNVAVPDLRHPSGGPPWWHALHLTATFVTVSLWAAMILGCAGVIAGLVAVARGARPPVRAVLALPSWPSRC